MSSAATTFGAALQVSIPWTVVSAKPQAPPAHRPLLIGAKVRFDDGLDAKGKIEVIRSDEKPLHSDPRPC